MLRDHRGDLINSNYIVGAVVIMVIIMPVREGTSQGTPRDACQVIFLSGSKDLCSHSLKGQYGRMVGLDHLAVGR